MENKKVAKSKTRLYNIWKMMRKRCNNPNRSDYKSYGGRGIKVCEEWNKSDGFDSFKEWAESHGYRASLTLDRKDVNGDYTPDNCRWIAMWAQYKNKRNTVSKEKIDKQEIVKLKYNGEYLTLYEWSLKTGIDHHTLRKRYNAGWKTKDIIETPVDKRYSRKKKEAL